jgi:iron(III) transport system permease protein
MAAHHTDPTTQPTLEPTPSDPSGLPPASSRDARRPFLSARTVRTLWQYGLMGFCLLLLLVFLVYPIILTVAGAFFGANPDGSSSFTFAHILMVFEDPRLRSGLLNSLKIAATTTTLTVLIALPLAVLGARYRFPGKAFFNAAILVPLILPPFVGAIGLKAILGREGALNALLDHLRTLLGTDSALAALVPGPFDVVGNAKFFGVVAVQALALYPIIYLNATAALANLDPALDEVGENLGARWWTRFRRITLPLVRPGIFAGATIVFIWSFTELGAPLMFDYYDVTPVQIFNGLKEVENSAKPYALTVVMLATAIALYLLGKWAFGGKGYAMYSKASRAASEVSLPGLWKWIPAAAFAIVTLVAILPHLGVVLMSLTAPGQWYQSVLPTSVTGDNYVQALAASDSFNSIKISLLLAAAAVVVDLCFGLLVAYLLVRTQIKGRTLLDALCMLPLAVPGLVMAFGFVAMSLNWPFGKDGPLSNFASVFAADPNPFPFLIVAYAVRRLPYIVRSAVAGLEQTSGELEEAAVNLGASRATAVRRVIVPLILANLIAGGLLVFAFSMLEVSDSLILAQQPEDYPITKAIWSLTERLGDGPYVASALGVWGMALLTVTLGAASVLLGKKLGSIFRV